MRLQTVLLGVLLVGIFALFGCSYSIGDLTQMAPKPVIEIKIPPRILDVDAVFKQSSKQPIYDTYCYTCCYTCCLDWCWDPVNGWSCCWWGNCCSTCCDTVWIGTDVIGDINLTISVEDPSNDLVEKESPTLKVFDSKQVPGKPCKLNITRKDYPLTKDNISGTGLNKVVTVSIKDVYMRFTSECQTFVADLPIRINCTDRGVSVDSLPAPFFEERITVKDP